MGEWKEKKLGEVAAVIDCEHKTAPRVEKSDFYSVRTPDVLNGRINYDNCYRVDEQTYDLWTRRAIPEAGDIILAREAPVGEVGLIQPGNKVCLGQRTVLIKVNSAYADSGYLTYYLSAPPIKRELKEQSGGSVVAHLNMKDIRAFKLSLPPLPEQRAIASMLSSLDAKIDLLHRQNKTLEAMAETLFRQWFLEEAEEGWEEGTLGDIIDIHDSKRVPLSNLQRAAMQTGKLYPYYGAATIMDQVNDFLFDGDYILLGEDGTVVTEEGYPVLQYATGKFWVNNHAHVLQAKPPYTNRYLWTYLKHQNIADIVTGAVQPKISQGNLKALPIVFPPAEVVEQICAAIAPLYAKLDKNIEQTRSLTALRDTLLPKLMSGEVRVEEISTSSER